MEHFAADLQDPKILGDIIKEQRRLLTNCMAERDRASEDRDRTANQCGQYYQEILQLNSTIARLEAIVKHQETNLQELMQKSKAKNTELEAQITSLTEQVAGKRAVWYEHNPRSAARSSRQRNPFATPPQLETPTRASRASSSARGQPLTQMMAQLDSLAISPNVTSFSNRSPNNKSPNTTEPSHSPALPSILNFYMPNSDRIIATQNGYTEQDVLDSYPVASLIPFESNEELIQGLIKTFDDIYTMVCGWVTMYADKINPIEDAGMARYPRGWAYMLSCLNPLIERDAARVLGSFQRDRATRRWFVMRMIVQYIHLHVWSFTNWLGFNAASDANISRICHRLISRGVPLEERSDLLAQRTATIKAIVEGEGYATFRKHMIGHHTKKLREFLPLVLNTDTDRADAGRDLSAIMTKSFDLSARLFTCGWTFIINMPEANARFLRSSMRANNSDADPLGLQIRHTRIKFAVTPFVTIRDDSGLAIVTKNIDKAAVLIEK